jgi:hypothetical protein
MAKTKEEINLYHFNWRKNKMKDPIYAEKIKLKILNWHKNNPDKRKEYRDKHSPINRQRNTNFINRVKLKFGCKFCGYKEHSQALQFDHINKKEKYENISILKGKCVSINTLKEEMRKCQILCANCHAVKTYQNRDYIKNE